MARKRTGRAARFEAVIGRVSNSKDELQALLDEIETEWLVDDGVTLPDGWADRLLDITPHVEELTGAVSEVEELQEELQSWHDNLPENLQCGEKASQLEDAISELENCASELNDISAPDGCDKYSDEESGLSISPLKPTREQLETLLQQLQEIIDAAENAEGASPEFPGMFG